MEIVNIEARTFEAMLSAFRTFADRLDTLCRLYGDMEEKKWLDNQEVCLLLKVSPRTLQTLRDNGTLAYTQICHKTYYKPANAPGAALLWGVDMAEFLLISYIIIMRLVCHCEERSDAAIRFSGS